MKEWMSRPPELAAHLNPAFCGYLISIGIKSYTEIIDEGVPYVFPFIMLPLVLHKPTRDSFPRNTRTAFTTWITNADTAIAKIGFSNRAKNMVPYVKESLIFTMQHNHIDFTESGLLKISSSPPKFTPHATQEVKDCIRAASMCGKWLAMVGDFKTTMALLGVRP